LDIIIKLTFGISTDLDIQELVRIFDLRALKTEAIIRGGDLNWLDDSKYQDVEPIPFLLMHFYDSYTSKKVFLKRWKDLENV
jgi:hypothetical protein